MTPEQVEIARHALGLNYKRSAYRNYYIAGTIDLGHLRGMVEDGMAIDHGPWLSEEHCFTMTKACIEAVRRKGESVKQVIQN